MEVLITAFIIAAVVWLFPFILAFLAVVFCLCMALLLWIWELLTGTSDK